MTEEMSFEDVFTINELDNAVDYLEMVNHFLETLDSEWKWKWVAISLHQALYSLMICGLAGTSPKHNVIERDIESNPNNHWHKVGAAHALHIEGRSQTEIAQQLGVREMTVERWLSTQPRLISFEQALQRIQSSDKLPQRNVRPLTLSDTEADAIDRLKNDFRNEFEHFRPKTWIDPVSSIPALVRPVLDVIQRLALESNFIFYLRDDGRPSRIKIAINSARSNLG